MDLTERMRRAYRALLGLRDGDAVDLWRLGLYPARVDACAADGSTVDLTPLDDRVATSMSGAQGIPLRQPIPNCKVQVQAGAICRLGWDGGDPGRPYALPTWDAGGSFTSLTITGGDVTITGGAIAISAGVGQSVKVNGGGRKVAANTDLAGPYPVNATGLFFETQ